MGNFSSGFEEKLSRTWNFSFRNLYDGNERRGKMALIESGDRTSNHHPSVDFSSLASSKSFSPYIQNFGKPNEMFFGPLFRLIVEDQPHFRLPRAKSRCESGERRERFFSFLVFRSDFHFHLANRKISSAERKAQRMGERK